MLLKYLRNILDFILFSNLFIGLCAAAQVAFSYEVLAIPPNLHLIGLVFFATLLIYNMSMLCAKPKRPEQSPFRRVQWVFSHERLFIAITVVAVVGTAANFLVLSKASQVLILLLGFVSMAYNLPLIRHHEQRISLRNIPGIKIFVIAGVWTLSTLLLPLLEFQQQDFYSFSKDQLLILLLQKFIFLLALIIPFDIRDLYQDSLYSLKTIPTYLGEKRSYRLCLALLAVSAILAAFPFQPAFFMSQAISCGLAAWLIFKVEWEKNEYYYFLGLDGILLLPWTMMQLFKVA